MGVDGGLEGVVESGRYMFLGQPVMGVPISR